MFGCMFFLEPPHALVQKRILWLTAETPSLFPLWHFFVPKIGAGASTFWVFLTHFGRQQNDVSDSFPPSSIILGYPVLTPKSCFSCATLKSSDQLSSHQDLFGRGHRHQLSRKMMHATWAELQVLVFWVILECILQGSCFSVWFRRWTSLSRWSLGQRKSSWQRKGHVILFLNAPNPAPNGRKKAGLNRSEKLIKTLLLV